MKLRLKEIRQLKGLKASEVAEQLSITRNSLSEWENGSRIPPCERIIQLADFYQISVDYLLGRDTDAGSPCDSFKPISKSSFEIHHGRPVWIADKGWALVNSVENVFVFFDGSKLPYDSTLNAYTQSPPFCESVLPDSVPIALDNLSDYDSVWVEPISVYGYERSSLRGWYTVKDEFVENKRGNRFFFDSYGATWYAFESRDC